MKPHPCVAPLPSHVPPQDAQRAVTSMPQELQSIILSHKFGIASRVAETTIACLYEEDSNTDLFLRDVHSTAAAMGPRHGINLRAITRSAERKIYRRALSQRGNNYTCVVATCSALAPSDAAQGFSDLQIRWQARSSDTMMQILHPSPLVFCLCLRTQSLAAETTQVVGEHTGPPLEFTGQYTQVGCAPIFRAHWGIKSHTPSTRFVMYGPAGKIKLWAGRGEGEADNCERVLNACLTRFNAGRERALRAFTYSDCVNYNKRELMEQATSDMTCKAWIHKRLQMRPEIFWVFDAEEGQGAARLEVEVRMGKSQFACQGNINIFMSYPGAPFVPGQRIPPRQRTFVRVNVTGRFSYSEAINHLDLVSIAMHAPESVMRSEHQFRELVQYLNARGHTECVAINRRREISRLRATLHSAHVATREGHTYALPLRVTTCFDTVEKHSDVLRQCFMCLCVHNRAPAATESPSAVTAVCKTCTNSSKEQGCPFHAAEMKTTYRKVPTNSHVYMAQDGPVALALDMACHNTQVPTTARTHCCSSCFQQNNRRKNITPADATCAPHPNLKVIFSMLFMGHGASPSLKRRNSIKLLRRFVRIVTSACVTPSDDITFLCPKLFRPLLQQMALRWQAAGYAQNRAHAVQGASWNAAKLCDFRRWCMDCAEVHWVDAMRWMWTHGCGESALPGTLDTKRAAATACAEWYKPMGELPDTVRALRKIGFAESALVQVSACSAQLAPHLTLVHVRPVQNISAAKMSKLAEMLLRNLTVGLLRRAGVDINDGLLAVDRACEYSLPQLYAGPAVARLKRRRETAPRDDAVQRALERGASDVPIAELLAEVVYICESTCVGTDGTHTVQALRFARETLEGLRGGNAAASPCAVWAYAAVMCAFRPVKTLAACGRPAKRRLRYLPRATEPTHCWG